MYHFLKSLSLGLRLQTQVFTCAGEDHSMSAMTTMRNEFRAGTRTATDSWTHSKNLPDWNHSYEQLKPGAYHGTFAFAWLGPLQLVHETVDGPGVYRGHSWKGSRVFFSVELSAVRVNNRLMDEHRLGSYRWDGLDLVTSRATKSITLMAVDERWLCERVSELTDTNIQIPGTGQPLLFPSDPEPARDFEREVQEMLRQVTEEPAILECSASRLTLQSHAVDLLVRILRRYGAPRGPMPAPSTRAYVVDRALQYFDATMDESVSVMDVCRAIRVCPRTLCYSFESVLGISPTRYLLASRLNRVRNDLRTSTTDVPIQSLAARWGFWHMGRFARYYRESFGERPSDTLRASTTKRRRLAAAAAM
jgi:AraC family transcriptional regulator, ethanolamine operon transcriptional activator